MIRTIKKNKKAWEKAKLSWSEKKSSSITLDMFTFCLFDVSAKYTVQKNEEILMENFIFRAVILSSSSQVHDDYFPFMEDAYDRETIFSRLSPATLLKKRLWRQRCFPVNFEKFLRTSFSYSGRLLVIVIKSDKILSIKKKRKIKIQVTYKT